MEPPGIIVPPGAVVEPLGIIVPPGAGPPGAIETLAAGALGGGPPAVIGGGGTIVFELTVHQMTHPASTTAAMTRPIAVGWFSFT